MEFARDRLPAELRDNSAGCCDPAHTESIKQTDFLKEIAPVTVTWFRIVSPARAFPNGYVLWPTAFFNGLFNAKIAAPAATASSAIIAKNACFDIFS